MNRVTELDRLIYSFKEGENENKLLLVKEKENECISWKPLAKGWDFQLWYELGERGGLAEAEELLVMDEDSEKAVRIEEYVKLYRETFANSIPVSEIFERFDIRVLASRKKDITREYVIKTLEEEYRLPIVNEDDDRFYYEKIIKSKEELEKITVNWIEEEHEVRMVFTEKELKAR